MIIVRSFIILMTMIISIDNAYAGTIDLTEVASNQDDKQWLDKSSLKMNYKGNIIVMSKLESATKLTEDRKAIHLYSMEVDCKNNVFQDLSDNGRRLWKSSWAKAENDFLISSAINEAGSYKII